MSSNEFQHTEQWWNDRCGKATASRIGDLMRKLKKGDWSADRNNYLKEKVAERITGKNRDRRKVASLDHRLDLEPDARAFYEFYNDAQIQLVGFVDHPRIPMAGSSPDGLVGNEGGVEIKCCDAEGHLEIVTADIIDPDYLLQIQFNMACTERTWWDFVAYNPDMPQEARLFVKRIERDEDKIALIEQAVIDFNAEVERRVEVVRAAISGKTALEAELERSLSHLHVVN